MNSFILFFLNRSRLELFAICVRSARQMAGWKTKNNNILTTESELWRIAGPRAFPLQVATLKSDEIL